ncbi:MAG: integrase, partial [Gloeomargaritales cyanobacterium]
LPRFPMIPVNSKMIHDCMLAVQQPQLPALFPLSWRNIEAGQQADPSTMLMLQTKPTVTSKQFGRYQIIYLDDKIIIPEDLLQAIVAWYHENLCHPGMTRQLLTITQYFWARHLRQFVDNYVRTCPVCQRQKRTPKKYGLLPPRDADTVPWQTICVDLIGPWTVQDATHNVYKLTALTIIDPATSWIEIIPLQDKDAETVALMLDRQWFSRYPRPLFCVYDNGSEFLGFEFQEMLESYGVLSKSTTVRNPQANSIVERSHQVIGDMLRTQELRGAHLYPVHKFDAIIPQIGFALRSTAHSSIQATPGKLVFGRDMILDRPYQPDWQSIATTKIQQIQQNNERENRRRLLHHYQIGDQVLVNHGRPGPKLRRRTEGPFEVVRVFTNGTVAIQRNPAIRERINIRRIRPFHPRNP